MVRSRHTVTDCFERAQGGGSESAGRRTIGSSSCIQLNHVHFLRHSDKSILTFSEDLHHLASDICIEITADLHREHFQRIGFTDILAVDEMESSIEDMDIVGS